MNLHSIFTQHKQNFLPFFFRFCWIGNIGITHINRKVPDLRSVNIIVELSIMVLTQVRNFFVQRLNILLINDNSK